MDSHLFATPHPTSGLSNRNINNSYKKIPRHIKKLKNQAEENKMKQSLSSLNANLKTTNGKVSGDRTLATRNVNSPSSSFSESSETESQQDICGVEMEFTGFRKTRDFGDFVTFSNSPSQLQIVYYF